MGRSGIASRFAAIHSSLDLQNFGFLDLMKIPFVQVGCAVHNSPANPIFGAKKNKNSKIIPAFTQVAYFLLTPFFMAGQPTPP